MRTLQQVFESGGDVYDDVLLCPNHHSFTRQQLAAMRAEVARECIKLCEKKAMFSAAQTIETLAKQLESEV